MRLDVLVVDLTLHLVRHQHHDQVAVAHDIVHAADLQAGALRLLP